MRKSPDIQDFFKKIDTCLCDKLLIVNIKLISDRLRWKLIQVYYINKC